MQQSSQPSTSKAAFMTDPALAGQSQSDGGASTAAGGSSETAGTKKAKASGNEASLLERLLRRLQDNRLQSGDPETARKLQEINQSQNASNIILKKILNIAFVTTGVALLLSVIFVIVYTSIVKHGSKDDAGSTTELTESHGVPYAFLDETNQLASSSSDAMQKGHVRSQQPLSRDPVILAGYDEYGHPQVDESSSSLEGGERRRNPANPGNPSPRGPGDASGGADGGLGVVTRCRAVPMVNEGELKIGKMCYQSKDDEDDETTNAETT